MTRWGWWSGTRPRSWTDLHFAVDPVQSVVNEAIGIGADLLVTHHPLLFRAVHTVAATSPKGRVVHDLISHGIGLYVATPTPTRLPVVCRSLASALGLVDLRPLDPEPASPWTSS